MSETNSLPIDDLISSHGIVALGNSVDRIPPDVVWLYLSWLDYLGGAYDPKTLPWLPIGNIGPLLLFAHFDPLAKTCLLPKWCITRFLISKENYLALLTDFSRAVQESMEVEYTHPEKPWSNSAPVVGDDHIAARYLIDHFIMDSSMRMSADVAIEQQRSLDDLPTGLREAVLHLRYQCPVTEMRFIRPDTRLAELAPNTFARYGCLAFFRTERQVFLATSLAPSDPKMRECIDNLQAEARFPKKPRIHAVIAPREQITSVLLKLRGGSGVTTAARDEGLYHRKVELELDSATIRQIDPHRIGTSPEETVNWLISQAISNNSQDLHADYAFGEGRFRLNVAGRKKEILRVAEDRWAVCNSIIRDLAHATKSPFECESLRFSARLDGVMVDFRLEATTFRDGVLPPMLTLRLAYRQTRIERLSDLRLREDYVSGLRDFIQLPHGIVLVCGPTGSGKTTTLYAMLNELNEPGKKIVTVENPIERIIEGIDQVEILEGRGITSAVLLRSFLRNAPDVIMVGEIRDRETAEIAVEAAGTGHLVLATLHTNTIAGAVTRLQDAFNINRSVLSDVLIGGVAQGLPKTLCKECKQAANLTPDELGLFTSKGLTLPARYYRRREGGCPACENTGTQGRVAIMELMRCRRDLRLGIRKGMSAEELSVISQGQGDNGMLTEGLIRVSEGLLDLEELRPLILLER